MIGSSGTCGSGSSHNRDLEEALEDRLEALWQRVVIAPLVELAKRTSRGRWLGDSAVRG